MPDSNPGGQPGNTGLPVHPNQSNPIKARQLLEIAERENWLNWDVTTKPITDHVTGQRTYRVRVPGNPKLHALTVDEVPGFVWALAATHSPGAVDKIRYRYHMTEE